MIELNALTEITNREYYLLLGFATVGVTAIIVEVTKLFNKYIWGEWIFLQEWYCELTGKRTAS